LSNLQRTVLRVLLFVVSLVVLGSVGGAAVYAAPLLLPLQWWAGKGLRAPVRMMWAVLAGATVAEVAWIITYNLFGEGQPQIWLIPIAAFALTTWVYARTMDSLRLPGRASL
jgi:hypothetical protein